MRRDSQLGLGRASWNHRMQTGGPSPAPVQRAPRSPARAGRADTQTACRLRATNSARRNRTRSVSRRHRLTSLTMNGMDAVITAAKLGDKGAIGKTLAELAKTERNFALKKGEISIFQSGSGGDILEHAVIADLLKRIFPTRSGKPQKG